MGTWIWCSHLSKRYSKTLVLRDISINIDNESVSLVGPNGAGKSTLISIIEGMTRMTSGEVEVMGLDPLRQSTRIQNIIGFTPERPAFYSAKFVWEIIDRVRKLRNVKNEEITDLLSRFHYEPLMKHTLSSLSMGEQQILSVIVALLWAEEAVILDEPNANVDIWRQGEFLDVLSSELKRRGLRFLISTHIIDKTIPSTRRTVVMNQGEIVYDGPTDKILEMDRNGQYYLWSTHAEELSKILDINKISVLSLSNWTIKLSTHLNITELLNTIPVEIRQTIFKIERTPIEEIIKGMITDAGGIAH